MQILENQFKEKIDFPRIGENFYQCSWFAVMEKFGDWKMWIEVVWWLDLGIELLVFVMDLKSVSEFYVIRK